MTYYIRSQIVPLQIVKTTTNSGIGLSGTSNKKSSGIVRFSSKIPIWIWSFLGRNGTPGGRRRKGEAVSSFLNSLLTYFGFLIKS